MFYLTKFRPQSSEFLRKTRPNSSGPSRARSRDCWRFPNLKTSPMYSTQLSLLSKNNFLSTFSSSKKCFTFERFSFKVDSFVFEYQQKGTNFFCGEKNKLRTEESLVGQDVLLLRLSVLLDIHRSHFTTNTFSHLRLFFSSLKI